jgi:pre-60S factor REI1
LIQTRCSARTCASPGSESHVFYVLNLIHVCSLYNLKRRMVSLPPVPLERYEAQIQDAEDGSPPQLTCPTCSRQCANEELYKRHLGKHISSDNASASDPDSDEAELGDWGEPAELLPTQCLFCDLDAPTLEGNVEHMYAKHGLFIPSPEHLMDLETFLVYLAALVRRYTECLYCGLHKASRAAVQAHMRDKGHCRINADPASELFEFWEFPVSDDDEPTRKSKPAKVTISDAELLLPSGAILVARTDNTHRRSGARGDAKRARAKAVEDGSAEGKPVRSSADRRIAVRGEQGLTGVSEQQRRALRVVEKKMMKREAVARSAQRWATEQAANRQKFFNVGLPARYAWLQHFTDWPHLAQIILVGGQLADSM